MGIDNNKENRHQFMGSLFLRTLQTFQSLFLALIISLSAIPIAHTQSIGRAQVVVSYTYNFAKNIRWPNEAEKQTFKIGLFQVNDEKLTKEFLKLNNAARIKNIPIEVKRARSIRTLKDYDLIFVGSTKDSTITQIQTLIDGHPTLMVTSKYANKRLLMINLFETQKQQLQFEVNKANIINNTLTPLPELILLGGTEIDVAKLYRQSQNSLLKIQKRLSTQQSNLKKLQEKNNLQKTNNDKLVNQMKQLNTDIRKTKALNTFLTESMKKIEKEIKKSETIIKQQKIEIATSEQQKEMLVNQVKLSNQELNKKQQELELRQKALDDISQTISSKEAELITLNSTIDTQEKELKKQQASIVELDELVNAQQQSLYFLWGLIAAGTALFFVVIFAYRSKRRDNRRLANRSQELQIARDKLAVEKSKAESANRAKDAFLSLMSHELRTPLQSIIGYTDLIIEELKSEGNATHLDQLTRVNTNGERLLQLINNTLDLAKIEAGKMKVELTPVYIPTLIDEAIGNVRPQLNKNNNKIITNINNNALTPELDYEKLLIVLVNLLSNAAKFTKNGEIKINLKNTPQQLLLIVSDTGVGLSKEQLEHIFHRFHQANHNEHKMFKGTGLGLSITQHFCEIMGGTISVESKKQQGSSFIVNIPLPVNINEKQLIETNNNQGFEPKPVAAL